MGTKNDMKPATPPSVKFTYEDFVNFPNDGKRHEIIDGEHCVTPSPNTKHQAVSITLAAMLWTYLKDHPIGSVFAAPFDVVFSDLDVVEPDLLYISRERGRILTDQHVRGAPDLVVEILSPGTRKTDVTVKRKLYERFGVHEYWIVDPELDAIEIHRRVNEAFPRVAELTAEAGDVLTTPLLPGFAAPLADLFASPFST
ncbi:MAG: Uma2 family endonuclease [Acidobacteria bacterium]|nr:Uma2 family endonuclease [Acidobacteriota bacterium]